jgi:hypothetical protein
VTYPHPASERTKFLFFTEPKWCYDGGEIGESNFDNFGELDNFERRSGNGGGNGEVGVDEVDSSCGESGTDEKDC